MYIKNYITISKNTIYKVLSNILLNLYKKQKEIWRHLKLFGVPSKLISMIKVQKDRYAKFKFSYEKSEEFQTETVLTY